MFVVANSPAASEPSSSMLAELAHLEQKRRALRGLSLFFPLLLLLSTLFYWLIIVKHDALAMSLFMWTPGSAALITRLLLREKFPAGLFALKGRHLLPALSVAFLTPLAIGLVAYGLAWNAGLAMQGHFQASATIAALLPWLGTQPSLIALASLIPLVAGVEIIGASGEELGWRGYMLTQLIDAGVPRPILVSGLIWSIWHWPFILLGASSNGQPPLVTAGIFLITITSLGFISARLRLSSGSLWPSILLHAAWNGFLLEIFDAYTQSAGNSLWIGESGLLVAGSTLLVALITAQNRVRVMIALANVIKLLTKGRMRVSG